MGQHQHLMMIAIVCFAIVIREGAASVGGSSEVCGDEEVCGNSDLPASCTNTQTSTNDIASCNEQFESTIAQNAGNSEASNIADSNTSVGISTPAAADGEVDE